MRFEDTQPSAWEDAGSFFTDSGLGSLMDEASVPLVKIQQQADPGFWERVGDLKVGVLRGGDCNLVLDAPSGANAVVFKTRDSHYPCFLGTSREGRHRLAGCGLSIKQQSLLRAWPRSERDYERGGTVGESGQDSLNACGVRPVHRRNDRWNAAGSDMEEERDVADAEAAVLKQRAREIAPHAIENLTKRRALFGQVAGQCPPAHRKRCRHDVEREI